LVRDFFLSRFYPLRLGLGLRFHFSRFLFALFLDAFLFGRGRRVPVAEVLRQGSVRCLRPRPQFLDLRVGVRAVLRQVVDEEFVFDFAHGLSSLARRATSARSALTAAAPAAFAVLSMSWSMRELICWWTFSNLVPVRPVRRAATRLAIAPITIAMASAVCTRSVLVN
jgi:hypothetical protein